MCVLIVQHCRALLCVVIVITGGLTTPEFVCTFVTRGITEPGTGTFLLFPPT